MDKYDKRVTYIRQIWDLDDPLEELHFSGPVEKLCEAAEEKRAEIEGKKTKTNTHLCTTTPTTDLMNKSRKRSRCPSSTSGAMPEKKPERAMDARSEQSGSTQGK